MLRRVNVPSLRWLFCPALCLALCGISANAQSLQPVLQRPGKGLGFTVAPFIALSAAPTSVAAGDLNGDGVPDLVVTTKGSTITVFLADGKGGFNSGVQYPAGVQTGNALLADLNGDGKLDLVVTDSSTGTVNVLFGNGDGTFGKPASYAAIQNPVGLTVGNFAGKGRVDLAVASPAGLAILLNDGSGRFPNATPVTIQSQPVSLAAADLRGSGHDDLILGNQDGSMSVLLGDGSGGFGAPAVSSIASGPLSSVVAGDFNGDGKADIAVTQPNSNTLSVLLSRGDGSFQPSTQYAVGNGPAFAMAADLKGNGVSDLITVNRAANTFSVLQGNGDGTFQPALDFVAGNAPLAAVAGDFSSTGRLDLAVVNSGDNTISVPAGRGDGTFAAARTFRAGLESKAIASGDLNGDGLKDLVVVNSCGANAACSSTGTATVFLASADGTYRAASTIPLGKGPVSVALADLNGNKKLDLLAVNRDDKTLLVVAGNGDGTFGKAQTYSLAENPRSLYVGDFNNDGIPDVAIATDCGQQACAQPGNVDIWLGKSGGTLAEASSYAVGYSPVSIAAGDLRGTGNLDLAVANACGSDSSCQSDGTATLLAGDGKGNFAPSGQIDIGKSPSAIALGNLNGSGLDLVIAQRGSNQVAVMSSNGSGGFSASAVYSVGSAPSSLAIGDFNGDGRQDLAVANFQSSTVSVLYGTSAGTLQPAVNYAVGSGPEALVAVTSGTSSKTSLVTANGNTGATPVGNQITELTGITPLALTASTTTLAAPSPTSATVNGSVSFTATVTGTAGAGAPTGSVTFSSNGTNLADCTALSVTPGTGATSTVTCTTQNLQAGTDNLLATYSGDTIYSGGDSTATPQSITVSPESTTTSLALTTGSNPSTVDDTLTFTATVSAAVTTPISLSGNVTFSDNGTPIASCGTAGVVPITAESTAACTTSSLAGGNHAITATYGNDTNFSASSGFVTQTVNKAGGTMTLTSSSTNNTSTVNQAVTFTVSITPSTGNTNVPLSGTVTLTDNGGAVAGCTVSFNTSTGKATCTTSSLALGTHPIAATYSNDPSYSFSPAPLSQIVNQAQSSVTVSSSANPSTVNAPVTFTATITPNPSGSVSLTGTVSFTDTPQGGSAAPITGCTAASLATSGGVTTAVCTTSALVLGSHTITATYSGDQNFATSSNTYAQTVNAASSSITLTSSSPGNTSTVNQTVTFTANIPVPSGSAKLTGQVSFTDNAAPIAGCTAASVTATSSTNYTATCADSVLTAGSHAIAASYGGDPNFTVGGGTLSQTVNRAGSSVAVSSSTNPSQLNQSVTFTAVITPNPAGNVPLTGTVSFTDSVTSAAIPGCSAAAVALAGGIEEATCTTSGLAVSPPAHTVTATYSGDTNYTTNSGIFVQTVNPSIGTIAMSPASGSTSTVNTSVTFTATIPIPSGFPAPKGVLTFTDNGNAIAGCPAATPSSNWIGTCTDQALTAGTHTVVAAYSGDPNVSVNNGSTTLTVTQAASTTVLTSSINPSFAFLNNTNNYQDAVTFTATVSAPAGAVIPLSAGTVTFTGNGISAACAGVAVVGGQATCTSTTLPSGTDNIVATYSGDPNYLNSSSAPVAQVVQDYSVTVANVPTSSVGVIVTQGFTSSTDPFPQSQPIAVLPVSISGFNSSGVTLTCATSTGGAPKCSLAATSVQISGATGAVQASVGIVMDATGSSVAPGTYTFTVTATDPTTSIVRTTTFPVTVRSASVGSNALSVTTGATTNNSGNVTFNLPAGVTISGLKCALITGTGINGSTQPSNVGVGCTITPASVGSATSTSAQLVTASVTVTTNGTIAALTPMDIGNKHPSLLVAGIFGIPFMALIGVLRRRQMKRGLYSLLVFVALGIAALQGTGCGGSYHSTATTVTGGTTPPGVYYLLITGTDKNNNTYSSVLQLNVEL
jgi:Bacterial Ig-like domain (group 3)/FG-GAP-like repeat